MGELIISLSFGLILIMLSFCIRNNKITKIMSKLDKEIPHDEVIISILSDGVFISGIICISFGIMKKLAEEYSIILGYAKVASVVVLIFFLIWRANKCKLKTKK